MALHIQISWDLKAEEPQWSELNRQLRACLDGYSWVKPLTTTYVVKLVGLEDRGALREKLIGICKANPKEINLMISPAMQGGTYAGWLPKDMWDKLRERTGGAE